MNTEIPKVFISSVCSEFWQERQLLAKTLTQCGYAPIYSESKDFPLFSSLPPIDNCLVNVQKNCEKTLKHKHVNYFNLKIF